MKFISSAELDRILVRYHFLLAPPIDAKFETQWIAI